MFVMSCHAPPLSTAAQTIIKLVSETFLAVMTHKIHRLTRVACAAPLRCAENSDAADLTFPFFSTHRSLTPVMRQRRKGRIREAECRQMVDAAKPMQAIVKGELYKLLSKTLHPKSGFLALLLPSSVAGISADNLVHGTIDTQ